MNPYKYSYWYLMHVVTMLTLYLKCSIYLQFLIFYKQIWHLIKIMIIIDKI